MSTTRLLSVILVMETLECQIAAVQEVRWHPRINAPPFVPGYRVIYQHHEYDTFSRRRGGVAFIVRDTLLVTPKPELTALCPSVVSVWISLRLRGEGELLIGNVYTPPRTAPSEIPLLSRVFSRLPRRTLVCGDFNASAWWDPSTPSSGLRASAGVELAKILSDHSLVLLNHYGVPTNVRPETAKRPRSETCIDLAFATPELAPMATWTVQSEFPLSEHRPIVLAIQVEPLPYTPTVQRPHWKFKTADKRVFQAATETHFSPLAGMIETLPLEQQLHELQTAFERSARESMKFCAGGVRQHDSRPWYTPKLAKLKKSRNKALHFHRDDPTNESKKKRFEKLQERFVDELKACLSQVQCLWVSFACSLKGSSVWKRLEIFDGKKADTQFRIMGLARSHKRQADILIEFFSGVSANSPSDMWDQSFSTMVSDYLQKHKSDFHDLSEESSYNCDITEAEVNRVLDGLRDSSPGADLLPPWFFRNAGQAARQCVFLHCKQSFAQGRLPKQAKNADLVPLQKPGKNHSKPEGHRPISLLLVSTRICEAILNRRLYHWAESNFHIPQSQFGFRHFSSAVHPLVLITQQVRGGFHQGQQTVLVRLDIEKAYDKVSSEGLLYELHQLGLRGRMLSFVSDFLSERRYRVIRPAVTEYRDFEIGLPQGSSMSPLLFTLFIARLSGLLYCTDIEFADDITLIYTTNDAQLALDMLNHDLAVIEDWARKLKVSFGDKTHYFVFRRSNSTPLDLESRGGLRFFNQRVKPSETCVLLGMHLDRSLTFSEHIDKVEASAMRRVNRIRSLRNGKLVNNVRALLTLYKGWVRPLLEYGCEVYAPIAPYLTRRLERVQSACLRTILGARKNTPAAIVNNECSVSSLASRRDQAVLRMYFKILAFREAHPLRKALKTWLMQDRMFEAMNSSPMSFFGAAYEAHLRVLKFPAPAQVLGLVNPAPLPPWNRFHMPHKQIDVQAPFRRKIRASVREAQMSHLRSLRSATQYAHWHPTSRHEWLACLPTERAHLRIVTRLRSGYADIGPCGHYGDGMPCPACGGTDDVPHILRDCPAFAIELARLYTAAAEVVGHPVTMEELMGFSSAIKASKLRDVTTLTAKFIIAIRRFV